MSDQNTAFATYRTRSRRAFLVFPCLAAACMVVATASFDNRIPLANPLGRGLLFSLLGGISASISIYFSFIAVEISRTDVTYRDMFGKRSIRLSEVRSVYFDAVRRKINIEAEHDSLMVTDNVISVHAMRDIYRTITAACNLDAQHSRIKESLLPVTKPSYKIVIMSPTILMIFLLVLAMLVMHFRTR